MPINKKDFLTIESIHKINAKLQSVRIAFGAVIYFDGDGGEKERKTIQYMIDEFIRLFGSDFNSFCIDGTNHEWNGKSLKQGLTTLQKKLNRPGVYQEYTFHFAREDAYNIPNEFGIFAHTQYSAYKIKSVCGFILPIDIWIKNKIEVKALFTAICNRLSADQANGGLTITDRANYYFDGRVNSDENRKAEISKLLTNYPNLDLLYSDTIKLPCLSMPATDNRVWGLRWPSQINFIGVTWIKKIGGLEKIKKLCINLDIQNLETGICISIPDNLCSSSDDYLETLQQIAKITSVHRLKQGDEKGYQLLHHILDTQKSLDFIKRFDS